VSGTILYGMMRTTTSRSLPSLFLEIRHTETRKQEKNNTNIDKNISQIKNRKINQAKVEEIHDMTK
jgi:hypothetical protein